METSKDQELINQKAKNNALNNNLIESYQRALPLRTSSSRQTDHNL